MLHGLVDCGLTRQLLLLLLLPLLLMQALMMQQEALLTRDVKSSPLTAVVALPEVLGPAWAAAQGQGRGPALWVLLKRAAA